METIPHLPPTPNGWSARQYLWATVSLLLCVSPVIAILAEWALAFAVLGRSPLPESDSPTSISPLFTIIHFISTCFVYSPFFTPFLLPYLWWKQAERSHQTNIVAWGCVVLPIASIYILSSDPTDIAYWWLH